MTRNKSGIDFSMLIETYMEAENVLTAYETGKLSDLAKISKLKDKLENAIDLSMAILVDIPNEMRPPMVGILSGLYRFLGGAHMYLEEFDLAKECYENAQEMGKEIKMSAEIVQAHNNLGIIALKQSDPVEAVKQFKQAIANLDKETTAEFGKVIRRNLAYADSLISK
ncbi:MAG: tetratricopeptide repeat protein [Anaerolineales bacterium]|nr:tetratricopeptide repeat protein [Anaerolineales bacterium]